MYSGNKEEKTWYCSSGCNIFTTKEEEPECGACGSTMSTDNNDYDEYLQAIEDYEIALCEQKNKEK